MVSLARRGRDFVWPLILVHILACENAGFQAGSAPQPAVQTSQTPELGGVPSSELTHIQKLSATTESTTYDVDIIILLDTSSSMSGFVRQVETNLPGLINNTLERMKGTNYQLFVVGKDINVSVNGPKIGLIPSYIGSHDALEIAKKVISGSLSAPNLSARADSVKELVVVSNDDSASSAAEFISWLDANPSVAREVRVNSIVGRNKTSFLSSCYIDNAGTQYIELGANQRTKGLVADLCTNDWSGVFQQLGHSLSQQKTSPKMNFKLDQPVKNPSSISVVKNGTAMAASEWKFDAGSNSLILTVPLGSSDLVIVRYH